LRAPIAVTVEVRALTRGGARDGARRAFRLAWNIGDDGLRLERPAPFEIGRPVEVRFTMPDGGAPLRLHAEVRPAPDDDEEAGALGGRELIFLSPDEDDRRVLRLYVTDRLGLPDSMS
jgi:hypothetical protein